MSDAAAGSDIDWKASFFVALKERDEARAEIEQSFRLLNRCLNVLCTTPGIDEKFIAEVDRFVSQRLYSDTTRDTP